MFVGFQHIVSGGHLMAVEAILDGILNLLIRAETPRVVDTNRVVGEASLLGVVDIEVFKAGLGDLEADIECLAPGGRLELVKGIESTAGLQVLTDQRNQGVAPVSVGFGEVEEMLA